MLEKDFKDSIMNIKNEILPSAVAKLPWTHNIMLIEKIKEKEKRFWYANEAAIIYGETYLI